MLACAVPGIGTKNSMMSGDGSDKDICTAINTCSGV